MVPVVSPLERLAMSVQSSPPPAPWLHAASASARSVFDEAKGRVREAAGVLSDERGLKDEAEDGRATGTIRVGRAAEQAEDVGSPKT